MTAGRPLLDEQVAHRVMVDKVASGKLLDHAAAHGRSAHGLAEFLHHVAHVGRRGRDEILATHGG